jgi:hypothetical protein
MTLMKKLATVAFAAFAGAMVSHAQADPLLDEIINQASAVEARTEASLLKINAFCTHFNDVVAPALNAAGISKSLYAEMETSDGNGTCWIRDNDGFFWDSPVTIYNESSITIGAEASNDIMAKMILKYLTVTDRQKLAGKMPGILQLQ